MIPARFAPYLQALLLSGIMSFIVSGVATLRALGPVEGFFGAWISAWVVAWAVAFVSLLGALPLVRRIVAAMTRPDDPG